MTELFSQKNKKALWLGIGGMALFLIVLMIIGTFFDYQIAHGVGVEQFSFFYIAFGMIFEGLGFLPAIMVDATLLAVLCVYASRKRFKIPFHIGCAMFLAGGVYCAIFWTLANHGIRIHPTSSGIHHGVAGGISTMVGAALSFPFIRLFKKLPRLTLRKLIYILSIGAIMATLANATTGIMQPFWGRYRFYAIVRYDIPFYTPWYQPFGRGGTADGFGSTSFPSMHASSVTSMIMLVLVGWVLGFSKKKMNILWAVTAVMLVAVPLSRMVLRWHFLTDVVFSLFIGLVSFVIGILIIDYGFGEKMKAFVNKKEDNNSSENEEKEELQPAENLT